MSQEVKDFLLKLILEFFAEWPVRPEVSFIEQDQIIVAQVRTGRDFIFIQPNPQPVLALQHLWRVILRKHFPDTPLKLVVDIGNFRAKQEQNIQKIVEEAIWQTKTSGNAVHLSPMSSFERRLVHTQVADVKGLISESEGNGPERHVVIRVGGE